LGTCVRICEILDGRVESENVVAGQRKDGQLQIAQLDPLILPTALQALPLPVTLVIARGLCYDLLDG
jgi:hypothetical protein